VEDAGSTVFGSVSGQRLAQAIAQVGSRNSQVFTASGTWTTPLGYDPDTRVTVELWGGGGGGNPTFPGGGGGGGGYTTVSLRYADLPETVDCVIGAGGEVNTVGGNTTFGAYATAYGGASGTTSGGGRGGHGGGFYEVGTGALPPMGGGKGSVTADARGSNDAPSTWGGGGGGFNSDGRTGGRAVYGGGGGGGFSGTPLAGGVSLYGGNGGAGKSPGDPRGGGGGREAAGGRGEIRIWL
jgi:hypothetical protein